MTAEVLVGVIAGMIANELCEFSPWCARKLVRWSASRRYSDPVRAEVRAEELSAVINDRPGNIFKLITALDFTVAAVVFSGRRAVAGKLGTHLVAPTVGAVRYSELEYMLARITDRTRTLSTMLDSDPGYNEIRALKLAAASDSAYKLARDLGQARRLAYRNLLSGLNRELTLAMHRTYVLVRDLDHICTHARDLNFYVGLGRSRPRELDLNYAHAHDLIQDFTAALLAEVEDDRTRLGFVPAYEL